MRIIYKQIENTKQIRGFLEGASSYTYHYALIAVHKLNLFRILLKRSYTINDLSEQLNVDPSGLIKLINILKSIGLIIEKNNQMSLPEFINNETIQSIEYWLKSSSDFIRNWKNILYYLYTKDHHESNKEFWRKIYSKKYELNKYAKAFEWVAIYTGRRLFEIMPCKKGNVLDVGTGTGMLLFEYIKNTKSNGTGIDFLQLEDLFMLNAKKKKLMERIKFLPEDFLTYQFDQKYDIITLSWIIHDLNDENFNKLLNKLKVALSDCGKIIIIDSILYDNDQYINCSSLEMYLSLGEGKERTMEEYLKVFSNCQLKILDIYNNLDFRKIFILGSDNKSNGLNKISLLGNLKEINYFIATPFGCSKSSKDLDFIIILETQPSFKECIKSLVNTILIIKSLNLGGLIYPCLEFKSYLHEDDINQSLHLLLYSSLWIFEKLESPAIKNLILKPYNKEIKDLKPIVYDYLFDYFDIIQKITNSLVLLLNNDFINIEIVESNAYLIAKYVKKWAPVKFGNLENSIKRLSFEEAIDYYTNII